MLAWRGGFGDRTATNHAATLHSLRFDLSQNKLIVDAVKVAKSGPVSVTGTFSFAGIEDSYFTAVALPGDLSPDTPAEQERKFLGKLTWQLAPSQRLAFSLILDSERRDNLGISSLTDVQSGFYTTRGGPTLTLKESAVFKPTVLLESSLSWFDNRFTQQPTMNPDTNGNGIDELINEFNAEVGLV